jgi:hypothetical protein
VAIRSHARAGLEREKLESLPPEHPEVVYRVMRAIVRTVHEIQRRLSMQSVELTNYISKQHGATRPTSPRRPSSCLMTAGTPSAPECGRCMMTAGKGY